jgi:FMN phosphatase YigB (HAD superfamily)
MDIKSIKCVIFDFGSTLSSASYFTCYPEQFKDRDEWNQYLQQMFFSSSNDESLFSKWKVGDIDKYKVAAVIAADLKVESSYILSLLEEGCRGLTVNPNVFRFAKYQKKQGKKLGLVTGNIDIFNDIIVPDLGLKELFHSIVNSCDHKTVNKEDLWPLVFSKVGGNVSYQNSLLIENSERNVGIFRRLGGFAFQYRDDRAFGEWVNFGSPLGELTF